VDLTGRPVSNTSRTYPDSRFGWMDDEVRCPRPDYLTVIQPVSAE
jgi:hypothetical protein